MRRTATYFVTVLSRLMSTNLPKTLNYIQYRLLCVTQATYRAIKVIDDSLKISKDVLMRRPATYFVTVLNRLMSTNLPKTLIFIQYRLLCVTQGTYRAIKVIDEVLKICHRKLFLFVLFCHLLYPESPPVWQIIGTLDQHVHKVVIPAKKISLRYLQEVI